VGNRIRLTTEAAKSTKKLWEPPTMQTDYSRRYQKVGGICTPRFIKIFRRR
jgi:hypothetical protein